MGRPVARGVLATIDRTLTPQLVQNCVARPDRTAAIWERTSTMRSRRTDQPRGVQQAAIAEESERRGYRVGAPLADTVSFRVEIGMHVFDRTIVEELDS